jgi:hypothetical protein
MRSLGAVLALLLVAGCAGSRHTPDTRYLGILLNARKLGAGEVQRIAADDPAVVAAVAQRGQPDFVLQTAPDDVQLIWYMPSVLDYFRRVPEDDTTITGELTPLPRSLLNILPTDLRAGTPPRSPDDPAVNCWTVVVGDEQCRTCCGGTLACTSTCTR